MPRVHLPDGRVLNFPDGIGEQEMHTAIARLGPAQAATAAPDPEDEPEGKSIGGFLANAAGSAWDLAKGTVEGGILLGKMGDAALKGGLPYLTDPQLSGMMESANKAGIGGMARGAKEYFGNRYGGLKELGETAYTDPFGLAGDVATVASLGGGAAARAPGLAGRIGRGVAAVGGAIDPMAAAGRAASVAAPYAGRVAERVGEGLNASALGISRKLEQANPNVNIPRAMAEEGIVLSRSGRGKLDALTAADDAELGGVISGSTKTVSAEDVTAPLRELAEERRGLIAGGAMSDEAGTIDARVANIMGPDTGVKLEGSQTRAIDPADLDARLPRAGEVVDGRRVRGEIPNQDSISASLGDDYEILPGVRDVPMSEFDPNYKPGSYSATENKRTAKLQAEIAANGEIAPLIIAYDADHHPYILEGGHRFDALHGLGAKSIPAMVVVDTSQVGLGAKHVPRTFSLPTAQSTKVALNKRLANRFGSAAEPALSVEMAEAERKGLMQAIAAAEPDVAPINARLGRRYAVGEAMDQAMARKRSPLTLSDVTKGGVGAGLGALIGGGIPGALVGGLASQALKSPMVKTLTARELFRASRAAPGAAATFAANGPLLTRLALLSRLNTNPEGER